MEQPYQIPFKTLDENSFKQLFHADYKGLCLFALKYVRDLETAREIVQDAFISLWEKRESINMEKSVKSYLTATIKNKCYNYLRDNKKFNSSLIAAEMREEEYSYESHDVLTENELSEKISSSISELPEKCREIFTLSRFENLKYSEIASKLGISVKTVETQMSKALQHMRLKLGEYLTLAIFLFSFLKSLK